MSKKVLFTIAVCFAGVFSLSAQVQIDHPIQLTGTNTNSEITGVKTVLNGQDAVNDSSVQRDILKYALATGAGSSGSPYAVTLSPAILAAYTTGMVVYFQAPSACSTGPVYVNVNALGAEVIKKGGSTDLASGDIAANQLVSIQYDGTNFEMQSQLGNSSKNFFSHYVGELFEGGIIVLIYDSIGIEHGLIASLTDLSTTATWSSNTTVLAGASSLSIGSTNTAAVMTQGATSGAAYLCVNYAQPTGGLYGSVAYTDWYLPSLYELNQIFGAALVINKVLGDANGIKVYSAAAVDYWSSTESAATAAWDGPGVLGAGGTTVQKTTTHSVRAIRRY